MCRSWNGVYQCGGGGLLIGVGLSLSGLLRQACVGC